MLLTGDLGFQSLVLVICFVVPVISFFIRRKWRLAVAKQEEIKRLLVLASEEAARAEIDASVGYSVVSTVPRYYECPVCYSPATTRCSQCKSVRYCSGKCQIIHWRQGHKEECCPPCPTEKITDSGNGYGLNLSEEHRDEIFNDKLEGRRPAKPIEETSEEHAFSEPCSPGSPCEKDEKETNSTSDSSDASFSGFFSSTSSSDSSNDVNENPSSIESDRLSGQLSAGSSFDMRQATFSEKYADDTKPVSPKFASLVDSINGFPKLNRADQLKHTPHDGGTQQSTCSSAVRNSVFEGRLAELPSGFWGRTLDSPCDDSDASDSYRESSKLPDPQSSLHFSLNLPVSTPLVLHTQGSGDNGCLSEESHPIMDCKPTGGANLSENFGSHVPKIKGLPLLNCEASDNLDDEYRIISDNIKSREVKPIPFHDEGISRCAELSKSVNLLPRGTKNPDLFLYDLGRNPNVLKASNIGCSSSNISNSGSATSVKESSVMNLKTAKDDAARTSVGISSQVSNHPNERNGLKTSVGKVVEQIRGSKISKHPIGMGSEIVGRYSNKGLFPYELFVKLYNSNKVELRPSGLINCGNSCYANAVLQCLVFTPPLTAYFLQGLHSKACLKKDWCFTCEFERLVSKAKEGRSPLSPIGILSQLQNIGSQLGRGREEDAHEYLRYAIETMQSVCLKEAGVNAPGTLEEETTMVGLTFGGYLRSKIKCTKCLGKSERQESMMDLTVEIEGDIATLEEALRNFTRTETLDGKNKYHCGRCKSYEKAKKKLTILEAPNILTIALKRFQSGKFGKLNKPIRFPEILDLAPFMSGTSDKSPIYRLYGVVVHLDIMNAAFSGHYVCYVKNAQNKWFKIDDSTVTPVELEKVLTKGAYMLLYARCSPRAPRLIRNRIAMPDIKTRAMPSWINGKTASLKSKSISANSGIAERFLGSTNFESSYPRLHQLQRILEDDSSSDSSSLLSSNSDEGSCSTDSTRDSASTDDLTDYLFGDPRRGWSSPWRNYSESDTSSSSSSPLGSMHSNLADLENYDSVAPQTNGHRNEAGKEENPNWDGLASGRSREKNFKHEGSVLFLHPNLTERCRKIVSSSRHRETDGNILGSESLTNVKCDIPFRRSTTERPVNI